LQTVVDKGSRSRPFSHPPHHFDMPQGCAFPDAQALRNMIVNDIQKAVSDKSLAEPNGVTGAQIRDAVAQAVVMMMSVLEQVQGPNVDPDWAAQLTQMAVGRAIDNMLTTLSSYWWLNDNGALPAQDDLNRNALDLGEGILAGTIKDINDAFSGCLDYGDKATGMSPASVPNIADLEGTIQDDLDAAIDARDIKDPNVKTDASAWAGEAAITLTSALINGDQKAVCQVFDTLTWHIHNHDLYTPPQNLTSQIEQDLSTKTKIDLSKCS
jgi:hypothetical protein